MTNAWDTVPTTMEFESPGNSDILTYLVDFFVLFSALYLNLAFKVVGYPTILSITLNMTQKGIMSTPLEHK